ncbi:MAG: hypothetical protein AAF632_06325 [Bacteroidota bacterium]
MKVTAELIRKYHLGQCSPEEAVAVERWLRSESEEDSVLAEEELDKMADNVWQSVSSRLDTGSAPAVPLYKKLTRYAAAACIIIGVFVAGLLTGFTYAEPLADTINNAEHLTDQLHIYGGDGAYGQIGGSRYRIEFEGVIKLENNSRKPKQVVCGEQEFTLQPQRTYFLSGSNQRARITDNSYSPNPPDFQNELAGGFSILRLDD